jgi:hypothetical protein
MKMKLKAAALIAAAAAGLAVGSSAQAAVVINAYESAGSVVFEANGKISVSSALGTLTAGEGSVQPNAGNIQFGDFPNGVDAGIYFILSGPASFGAGGQFSGISSGTFFSVLTTEGLIVSSANLDADFQSTLSVTGSFVTLGLVPGSSFVWTFGGFADGNDIVTLNVVPVPAALPLFATGIAAVAYAGRRKRKGEAAQATA